MQREKWNARYAATDLVWSAGPNEAFAAIARKLRPGTALDVACGEGRNALWLAEQGWAVTAVDISDVGIDKARAIGKRRGVEVDWVCADICTWQPSRPFDLVASVFLHTDRAARDIWLPRIIAAVAPGGTFVFIGHDRSNIAQGIGGPRDPELLMTPGEVLDYLAGFDVDRAEVVERAVAGEPGHGAIDSAGIALDTLVVATRPDA